MTYNPHNIRDELGAERECELTPWGHLIGRSVYPLFIIEGGFAFPIGTAFLISAHGIVLTAAHNIFEGIRREPRLAHLVNTADANGKFSLHDIGFGILAHYPRQDAVEVNFFELEHVGGAPPTDLVVGSIANFHDPHTDAPLTISPGLPELNQEVFAIGYHGMPSGGISIEEIKADPEAALTDYQHHIRVARGTVKAIFVTRFASGYVDGPAFLTDFDVHGGQSGGPVFGPKGVCGLITGTASQFCGGPASVISMLYPLLATSVTKTVRLAPNFTMNLGNPVLGLIKGQLVKTDGSEASIQIIQMPDGMMMYAPKLLTPTTDGVFYDFAGYQAGENAQTLPFAKIMEHIRDATETEGD